MRIDPVAPQAQTGATAAWMEQDTAGRAAVPLLVLFKGHPGVGKSTLARAVCRHLQWPLIDKDDARDCLQRLPADVQQSIDANQLSYDIMFSYCNTQLQLGLSTVLDCPFARLSLYQQAVQVANRHGAAVAVVECVASNATRWRQQLEARGAEQQAAPQAHKPQSWEELQQLLNRYGDSYKWTSDGSCSLQHHLVVDTTEHSLQQQLNQVLDFVSAAAAAAAAQQSDTGTHPREQQQCCSSAQEAG